MAGIYLHVPFCRTVCIYCDFYKTTNLHNTEAYVQAVCKEVVLRKSFFSTTEEVQTIYFGGGTPSVLSAKQLDEILNCIQQHYKLSSQPEITLEVNPDDVSPSYLQSLQSLPINRISMGVQSFDDEALKFFKRRHTRTQAIQAFELLRRFHYPNISLDLIFGIPKQSFESFSATIQQITALAPEHISIYDLIYEEGTPLHYKFIKGKVKKASDEHSTQQYEHLVSQFAQAGYSQYEVSNFCKPGFESRHNSSYWDIEQKYLGVGPSAHSYTLDKRQWNTTSSQQYIREINQNKLPLESEHLDVTTKYNEYLLTGLRTCKGIDLEFINKKFGEPFATHCLATAKRLLAQSPDWAVQTDQHFCLTQKGLFLSDRLLLDFLL